MLLVEFEEDELEVELDDELFLAELLEEFDLLADDEVEFEELAMTVPFEATVTV